MFQRITGTGECFIERYCLLFQKISPTVPLQYLHLLDCNLVELYQAFALGHSIVDKDGIDVELRSTFSTLGKAQTYLALLSLIENVLHVREADEFVDSGIVADCCLSVLLGF